MSGYLAIVDMLNFTKLIDEVVKITPRDATKEEITLVHTPEHFDKMASLPKESPKCFWTLTHLPAPYLLTPR